VKKGKRGKRKKTKRRSVNQYWRDFKMLYYQINGKSVHADDSNEVVKVYYYPVILLEYLMLTRRLKYINSELKTKFDLDTISKPKPVAGPDDLLLLLT
jgi:hypothetical protein